MNGMWRGPAYGAVATVFFLKKNTVATAPYVGDHANRFRCPLTVHNLPYSTVIFSCAVPFRPVACSSHSPGASCQKKRPSRRGNTGTPFIYHCTSFPIVADGRFFWQLAPG